MSITSASLPFGLAQPFVLAPMCDFLALGQYVAKVGPADIFHIEYTRVHEHTAWEEDWVGFIHQYGPQHRVIAQLLGEDLPSMAVAARYLQTLPIAGVDLNMGCPAPKIYKNNVGGGLLRDLPHVDRLIGTLRDAVKPPFTFSVKFRLGFDEPTVWPGVMEILRKHGVDWTTVHLRTVADGYRAPARLEMAAEVVAAAPCPVLINGDIQTVDGGRELIAKCGAWGATIGRGAIRYPWIFAEAKGGHKAPTYADAFDYYMWIIEACGRIGAAKGYLNFLGLSVEPTGKFLKEMRGVQKLEELEAVGRKWLLREPDMPFPRAPFENLYARPSMEKPKVEPINACSMAGQTDGCTG